jgi:hypothetical protein
MILLMVSVLCCLCEDLLTFAVSDACYYLAFVFLDVVCMKLGWSCVTPTVTIQALYR